MDIEQIQYHSSSENTITFLCKTYDGSESYKDMTIDDPDFKDELDFLKDKKPKISSMVIEKETFDDEIKVKQWFQGCSYLKDSVIEELDEAPVRFILNELFHDLYDQIDPAYQDNEVETVYYEPIN